MTNVKQRLLQKSACIARYLSRLLVVVLFLVSAPPVFAAPIVCSEITLTLTNENTALTVQVPDSAVTPGEDYILEYRLDGSVIRRSGANVSTWNVPDFKLTDAQSRVAEIGVTQSGGDVCPALPVKILTTEDGVPVVDDTNNIPAAQFNVCKQASALKTSINGGRTPFEICETCYKEGKIWTAFGCISFSNTANMVSVILSIGLGIAGLTVVLMILYGSLILTSSQGDLKRVEEGRSAVTSAVMGIIFILFCVTILRFIGATVLTLPGF